MHNIGEFVAGLHQVLGKGEEVEEEMRELNVTGLLM